MRFIDTHAHLFWEKFADDLPEVVDRAVQKGIEKMYCPNVDLASIEPLKKISKEYDRHIFPLMGLHPGSVKNNFEKDLQVIENELDTLKYYGVGEVGIDLYRSKEFKAEQIEAFTVQVQWAKKLHLPVIIHAREALPEIFAVIDKEHTSDLKGIFHCFSGTLKDAHKIIEYGTFKMGIGGNITYKNSHLPEVVKQIDLKHIVLETDAPFLAPVPKRGQRNESAFMIYTAEFIAALKSVSLNEVADITTANAEYVFGK